MAVVRGKTAVLGARHRLAVDVEDAVDDLDPVARQTDEALDVVDLGVRREAEYDDVATLRLTAEDSALEQVRRERQRILRIAVGELVDEDVVADQQRRHHRARRNGEGLEQDRADDHRQEQSLDDDLDILPKGTLLLFRFHAVTSFSGKSCPV